MNINDRIIAVAEDYEGLVEVISNAEWDDPKTAGKDTRAAKFEAMLKSAGHEDGYAYCMSFCEGAWSVAYSEQKNVTTGLLAQIKGILMPHVMTSYHNANNAGLISRVPERGAIGFMQNGSSSSGHAFLVLGLENGYINTIEAKTSPSAKDTAADRDGGIGTGGVWRKRRLNSLTKRISGLWIRGFLNPIKVS